MTLEQNLKALVETIAGYLNGILTKIGVLSELKTTDKSSLVNAINEIKTATFTYRTYTFTNVEEVVIDHNLNSKNFFINVYDSNDNELIVYAEPVDLNTIKINFPIAMSGKVDIAFKTVS